MNFNKNRRDFLKMAAISGAGLGVANSFPSLYAAIPHNHQVPDMLISGITPYFIPRRAASWWCTIEDLQWSQKKIVDKIKRRAENFAKAKIDTAINFGFHIRFDFSNYFGQLHGYYANVCEELHKYDIKFMDHYSCNHVERPRGEAEFKKLHKGQRHHVLLFPDPIAAQFAQYEGYFFKDICEVDLIDGGRGYSKQYQMETFCHNNPNFLDMHRKYLIRLAKEVPFDGIEVDDMCTYAGLTTCGCKYCRERFKRDYGSEIPPFGQKDFWGDTTKPMAKWGNYENPVFRDWLRMKTDGIVDHVKMIKGVIGDKPLMSCCSSTGPMSLNVISLDLEKMAGSLDFFMLENVGFNVKSVDWMGMDAEALHQKDIAQKRGNAPAMALSYTIYEKGGYLGWCLSRFWGVGNWSSTLNQRLEEDPADAMEQEDVISPSNLWEVHNSDLNIIGAKDLVEARLVSNRYCRDNGWHTKDGAEHWDKVKAWSVQLLKNNVGYRFVRSEELGNGDALTKETTPLIIDSVGCVSDRQFKAIKGYLAKGGTAWLTLPFGTHNEKGFKRDIPLSATLLKEKYKHLMVLDGAQSLPQLISSGKFKPVLKQVKGDNRWVARIRIYNDGPAIHLMNTALTPIAHPVLKDNSGTAVLKDIASKITDNELTFEVDTTRISLPKLSVMSPELGQAQRRVHMAGHQNSYDTVTIDLADVKLYAVAQKTK
ncbi:twin-arginine translocation signal domain-containing protein [Mucilaginibacter boryungensis]|uniref:Twin-arginine translocation signal domain-containing protein n=1 Tax=Mucilaginibacter boryungensis TaxID=768480 RepID=A0ABR9XEJ7_9SPHI|nr:twin-arginine translocation signal domain-containing protein [Mucilaginibacter boryungensis]MBE9665499.1 twin-arginine translocation signal domain-containing protein [Mucilaginibacter boryungensis]